jgi:hypothetical protein
MKKLITLMVVLFSSLQMFAQGAPQKVVDAFNAKYPNASEVKWSNKLTRFTAWFTFNGERLKANFNDDGAWKNTEFEMSYDALPAAIKDGLKKTQYADWKVEKAARVDGEGRSRMYRVEVQRSTADQKNLFFDEKGAFIREGRTL